MFLYKDQQATNTIFWPVLSFLKGLLKLPSILTCTFILRSNGHKRAVNGTANREQGVIKLYSSIRR